MRGLSSLSPTRRIVLPASWLPCGRERSRSGDLCGDGGGSRGVFASGDVGDGMLYGDVPDDMLMTVRCGSWADIHGSDDMYRGLRSEH